MLSGVRREIKPGEVIGLTYGKNKARFRVQWVGQRGSSSEGHLGLHNVLPSTCVWDITLAPPDAQREHTYATPRNHPRLKCSNSVQLDAVGQPPVWSKLADVSEGGCFVEMMIPVQAGTRLKISLWLKDNKVVANGVVVHSRPAYGVGIRFTDMSHEDSERLREFLKSMVRIPTHV